MTQDSIDQVGSWARQKLDALERYLHEYLKVMKYQQFHLIYIDGFAGAGLAEIRQLRPGNEEPDLPFDDEQMKQERDFILGSPMRALRVGGDRKFDSYYFFDDNQERERPLNDLKQDHLNKNNIHIQIGDANQGIQNMLRRGIGRFHRIVAFLDPYGTNLHWETVKCLAATRKADVIINFPLAMAINRMLPSNGNMSNSSIERLNLLFGTEEWHGLVYEEIDDMFGDNIHKREDAQERLLGFYNSRLKAKFGYVVNPSLVRNTRRNPLYYLMWASSNNRGVKIADHILKLGERVKPLNRPRRG